MTMDQTYFNIIVVLSLVIWNIKGQESVVNKTTTSISSIKPITYRYPYQTLGFDSNDVKSGPILLIDKKTIFISNLNYDGSHRDANFWVGTGLPSSNGSLVPDEDNFNDTLISYHGQNIYLKLPGNLTTDKIDYLGIWSIERQAKIDHVMLYSNASEETRKQIPEPGFHQRTENNKTIFRVPKCCELYEIYLNGCKPANTEVKIEYQVYLSNQTHIDPDKFMNNDIEFMPYVYNLQCHEEDYFRVTLDTSDTTFGLLFNSSLIYGNAYDTGILSHGQYCMENINGNETKFLVCAKPTSTDAASMPNIYFPFLIISTLCFLLSALCYLLILKPDVHNKCFIGYSSSMTVTFLSLIFLQKLNVACNFIGSLFIFSMLCSFVWLTCLCIDLIFVVKSYKRFSDETRIYYYIGSSFIIPVIFLIASVAPDGVPDVPKSFVKMYPESNSNICEFEDAATAIFFTPIGILILVCLIALVYTSYVIRTHKDVRDYDWVNNKDTFKFMLRSCFLIWTTTCIWLIEALVYLISNKTGLQFAIDLIEASQGIFVAFIFVLNKYTRKEIKRVLEKDKHKKEREMQYGELVERLNQPRESHCSVDGSAENERG